MQQYAAVAFVWLPTVVARWVRLLQLIQKGFLVKTLRSEVMASFAYHDSPRRHSSALELAFSTTEYSKVVKRLTVGYALPGTLLDIRQKARVLWQSLSLLSQCSEHVTIPYLRACAGRTGGNPA